MKICIVQSWGFQNLDGSNLRVYFLIKELIKRGHKVTIVHASKQDALFSQKEFGCETVDSNTNINRWVSSTRKLYDYSKFILNARKVIKKIDCDIIFGISFLNAMVVVTHLKAKKIIMYVDLMSHYYHYETRGNLFGYLLYKLGNILENWTMKKADRIITITHSLRNLFKKDYWPKTVIIPDGVDTKIFNPNISDKGIRKELGLENNKVIGYFGAVDPCDGVQFLAQVAPLIIKEYPETRFLIVGHGLFLSTVKRIAKKNKTLNNFIFTGWVKNNEVPSYMKATDICVVPNVSDKCIASLITYRLLEGMAAGVLMLASNLPGIREIANENMIFFTNPEDINKFAEDIIKIFKTPNSYKQKMKNIAWETIKKLDWREIAIRDANVIENHL